MKEKQAMRLRVRLLDSGDLWETSDKEETTMGKE